MCGRYTLTSDLLNLKLHFGAELDLSGAERFAEQMIGVAA